MVFAELLLPNLQSTFIQRLRVLVAALRVIQPSQIVQGGCNIGMVFAKALF